MSWDARAKQMLSHSQVEGPQANWPQATAQGPHPIPHTCDTKGAKPCPDDVKINWLLWERLETRYAPTVLDGGGAR
eukprot:152741-Chlamydomonas_euryale.AAC.3